MIYVEVNFCVAPQDRAAAVDCLTKEAPAIRAQSGNRGCRILIDPVADDVVTLLHQWDDLASLDAYRSGPLFAHLGGILRPMMTGAPSTMVYDASLIG
jgi:quinol monooxygenase YgiN